MIPVMLQEDTAIVNVHTSTNRACTYMKQKIDRIKGRKTILMKDARNRGNWV